MRYTTQIEVDPRTYTDAMAAKMVGNIPVPFIRDLAVHMARELVEKGVINIEAFRSPESDCVRIRAWIDIEDKVKTDETRNFRF